MNRVNSNNFFYLFLKKFINVKNLTISPDSFEVIEKTILFVKYVNDHIAVIHKNPAGVSGSLNLFCFKSGSAKCFIYIVNHSLNLILVGSTCNYKIIGNYRYFMDIYYLNIFSFFLIKCAAGKFCHFKFSVHGNNLSFYLRLVTDARHHIEQGDFVAWKNSIIDQLGRRI